MNGLEDVGLCQFCNKIIVNNQKYYVYRLGFRTTQAAYTIGIMKICEELANDLIMKGIHLSATQVVLLRPDIMLEFLHKKYDSEKEQVVEYKLLEAEVCETCYNNYKMEIPLK